MDFGVKSDYIFGFCSKLSLITIVLRFAEGFCDVGFEWLMLQHHWLLKGKCELNV